MSYYANQWRFMPHSGAAEWPAATLQLFSKIVIPAGIAGIQTPGMGLNLPSMAPYARFPPVQAGSKTLRE